MPQYQQSQQGVQDRTVPVSRDLIYTAMKQYPGYDQQTALALYLIDQNAQQQQTDAEQTQLIQTQQQQNNKLTNAVKTIGKELYDFEQQSAETDKEVERLNALIARLKPGAGATAQAAKAGSEEVAKVQAELSRLKLAGQEELKNLDDQLKDIKNKPNIDKEKYEQLVKDIDAIKNLKSLESPDVQKIEAALAQLQSSRGDDQTLFNKIQNELEKTKQSLIAKEKRFRSYIKRTGKDTEERTKTSAAELQKYANIVTGYKNQIDSLKGDLDAAKQAKVDIFKIRDEIGQELQSLKDEQAALDIKRGLPRDTPQQIAAANATDQAITRMRKKPPEIASDLPTNIERQSELDRRYRMTTNPDEFISEDVRPAHNYADQDYVRWLTSNLPIIVKMFKHQYWYALEKKHPTYSDSQIAYVVEEFAPWLWNHEAEVLTQDIMDKFLSAVKAELWKQAPEPEQGEFDFKEGLDRIYESMLDQIINETLTKRR